MSGDWNYSRDGNIVTVTNSNGGQMSYDTSDESMSGGGLSTQEAADALEELDEYLELVPGSLLTKFLNKADFIDGYVKSKIPVVWANRNQSRIREDMLNAKVNPEVNVSFTDAKQVVSKPDPLTLDLDGDGIETVAANSGIVFDFDGDGLKTGTGWVKGDDGFLVLDRNGNGRIDTGKELFGVDTVKANGQKALDGFDALRDQDKNADGIFNAQDASFAAVRLWQDKNQDGIAQAGELKTLAEHNIAAINLTATVVSQNSNGNLISALGNFFRTDSSEGEVNANQSLAANLDLVSNPFYREFTDHIPLDAVAQALPTMRGSGAVRDLREAAMLNGELKALLGQYAQLSTRQEQYAQVDKMIEEWAQSSSFRMFDQRINDMDSEKFDFNFCYSWEMRHPDGSSTGMVPTAEKLEQKALLEKIKFLEVFNGQDFFKFTSAVKTEGTAVTKVNYSIQAGALSSGSGSAGGVMAPDAGPSSVYLSEMAFKVDADQARFINQAYEALRNSIYQGLVLQTRLKGYGDLVRFDLNESGMKLDYSAVTERLAALKQVDAVKAIVDLVDLRSTVGDNASLSQWAGLLSDWLPQLSGEQLLKLKDAFGPDTQVLIDGAGNTRMEGKAGYDFLLGNAGDDYLNGAGGRDQLDGGDGHDRLNGGDDNDVMLGATGSDTLYGDGGDDHLLGGDNDDRLSGGSDNDTLEGNAGIDNLGGGDGNDWLDGGVGNDNLSGDAGSDTYYFARGWGQDIISNRDLGASSVDVLQFAEGIAPGDIGIKRSGSDLILSLTGSTDTVKVVNYFSGDGVGDDNLEQIRFANGTVLSIAQVKGLVLQATAGNDTLVGYATDDSVSGGEGNDLLYGRAGHDLIEGGLGDDLVFAEDGNDRVLGSEGNDSLRGDAGNDSLEGGVGIDNLYGGDGADWLEGGVGNDKLSGDAGSDIYYFARGWGQDIISNGDLGASSVDTLEFAAGIAPGD
ncbi:MAG: calcium-binding protein, partial [Pseudomonas sp.]|uniref:calcium-binding protein n=1 Tax=Pseudomonas sp. TaxID=306 RepID=UPI003396EB9B